MFNNQVWEMLMGRGARHTRGQFWSEEGVGGRVSIQDGREKVRSECGITTKELQPIPPCAPQGSGGDVHSCISGSLSVMPSSINFPLLVFLRDFLPGLLLAACCPVLGMVVFQNPSNFLPGFGHNKCPDFIG